MLTIGKLAARTGVNIETIRYYEKIGLLPKPSRTVGGHRLYSEAQVRRLEFIRRGRELGFGLVNLRQLLAMSDNHCSCGEVFDLTREHLAVIRSKIRDLRRLEARLTAIAGNCSRQDTADCAVIDALSS